MVLASFALTLAGCSGTGEAATASPTVDPVDFTAASVFNRVGPQLVSEFKATGGKDVTFAETYTASAALARSIASGTQPSDVAILAAQPDAASLVSAQRVNADWNAGATKGVVAKSVVVIVVREGNPKKIASFDDLIKPNVNVVLDDPMISNKWNVTAAYAFAKSTKRTDAAVTAYLRSLFGNVVSWNVSGPAAAESFIGGKGDVLIANESEAIAMRASGASVDYVIPANTLQVEYLGAAIKGAPESAGAFLSFIKGADGQKVLAENGYRTSAPLSVSVKGAMDTNNPFPTGTHLTIDQVGGWQKVDPLLYDRRAGYMTQLRK